MARLDLRDAGNAEGLDAWLAAQACPTNSIGTRSRQLAPDAFIHVRSKPVRRPVRRAS
jgi:hypothetical protein